MRSIHFVFCVAITTLTACEDGLFGDDDSSYSSSGNYNGNYGGSGSPPSSTPDPGPQCARALYVSMAAPESSGDCRLTLTLKASTSYSSTGVNAPSASYFFPSLGAGSTVGCTAISGPVLHGCHRDGSGVFVSTDGTSDIDSLRSVLGTEIDSRGISVELDCAAAAAPSVENLMLVCASGAVPSQESDAGAGKAPTADASADARPTEGTPDGGSPPGDGGGCLP